MNQLNAANEDWDLLLSFLPPQWIQLAQTTGASKGLRQDKSEANNLRVLLMHLGCGLSLRETVVRAQQAHLADLSDVALLKRLRKSKEWLYQLCCALFVERGLQPKVSWSHPVRILDATLVKEPGPTGSQWRLHYSLRWPTLQCDFFKLTATEGQGTGESLQQYPLQAGDYVLVDRGYCQAKGIHYAVGQQAYVTVRLNPDGIVLHTPAGDAFPLLDRLKPLQQTGAIASWKVLIPGPGPGPVAARLCVIRKTKTAIALAQKRLRRKASKQGTALQPETLIYAEYVMVLTTFPEAEFPAVVVLEWYRFRWQIELVFKRFKQIAQLGHLPKHDPDSSRAWLYGKLLVALLTEKVIAKARAFSPWGYELPLAQTP
jgi:Transposase DDE domain